MAKYDIAAHFKYFLAAKEQNNDIILDANKLADEIYDVCNLSHVSREELEYRLVSVYTRVLLYQSGYRSIIRGKGFFVNENTIRPELVARLFNNEKMTLDKANQIMADMKKRIAQNDNLAGQLEFDFENGGLRESMTKDDLLRLLEAEAI